MCERKADQWLLIVEEQEKSRFSQADRRHFIRRNVRSGPDTNAPMGVRVVVNRVVANRVVANRVVLKRVVLQYETGSSKEAGKT